MPLLLKEESEGEGDFAFVDEQLLNEKIGEWKKERKRGKVEKLQAKIKAKQLKDELKALKRGR